jgi:collagenase-like PrtC family protease
MKNPIRHRWKICGVFITFQLITSASGLALPANELVNRRKSPALWREDLVGEEGAQNSQMKRGLVQRPPEVMSPVGGWPQLHAAIGNGADSIYLGLSAFSARARAANFDPKTQLPKAVATCHDSGVKVYVALNTLIFDHELEEIEELIRLCVKAKVDALIVQDLGLAKLARAVAPNLELHASTQQTVTSSDGASFCDELLDSSRIVLGRELSVAEIDSVASHLDPNIEIEAFVHGALCVSYSGQCFSSEFVGGRSANRGQCAQACRLPYGLIDNGDLKELGDFTYLLSPQDLCGIDQVPNLLESHVSCLKIEGRLKDAAYVSATTRGYRNAVDEAWGKYCQKHNISKGSSRQLSPEKISRKELAQVFSRGQDEEHNGLTTGFFEGSQHQRLVRGRSPRHRGVHIGRVSSGSSWKRGLLISKDQLGEVKLGDGLVVDKGLAQEEELGGAIYDIHDDPASGQVSIRFSKDVERKWKKNDDNVRKGFGSGILAPEGAHVWKTSDATVDKKMKRLSEAPPPRSTARVSVIGSLGSPLQIQIEDGQGMTGEGATPGVLEPPKKGGLTSKSVRKAVGTLGNTQWAMEEDIDMTGLADDVWCPISWIKEARRMAVEDLGHQTNTEIKLDESVNFDVINDLMEKVQQQGTRDSHIIEPIKITVLARDYDQVQKLCEMAESGVAISEIIVDFLEVDGMQIAVSRIREAGIKSVVASPRIIKPDEAGIWRTLLRLKTDSLLVRSNGLLYRMMKLGGPGAKVKVKTGGDDEEEVVIPELIGDFSLNVANALTCWELIEYGCSRVTASYDLSAHGIIDLLEAVGESNAQRVEVVAHTHLPIFHTEHCVFARFLSNGDSYVDCGHACTRHNVHLRDQTGADNLVLADMGCRNTVFSAQAQSGAFSLQEWSAAGANVFRIELVDESPEDIEAIVVGYLDVLDGKVKPNTLWESLENVCDSNGRKGGVSFGSLRNGVERRAGELS